MASREESIREMIEKADRTLLLVTAVVWISLTIFSALLVANSGIAGGGVVFIVYALALLIWGKLLRDWATDRRQLLNRLLEEGKTDTSEEIRRLREAIEKLRQSLES